MSRLDATGAAVKQELRRIPGGAPISRLDATGAAVKQELRRIMVGAR